MNGVLGSTRKCVLARPMIPLSHRMGEGRGEGYSLVFLMQLDRNRRPLSLTSPLGWERGFIGSAPSSLASCRATSDARILLTSAVP
jgi:hypothetical protein